MEWERHGFLTWPGNWFWKKPHFWKCTHKILILLIHYFCWWNTPNFTKLPMVTYRSICQLLANRKRLSEKIAFPHNYFLLYFDLPWLFNFREILCLQSYFLYLIFAENFHFYIQFQTKSWLWWKTISTTQKGECKYIIHLLL